MSPAPLLELGTAVQSFFRDATSSVCEEQVCVQACEYMYDYHIAEGLVSHWICLQGDGWL